MFIVKFYIASVLMIFVIHEIVAPRQPGEGASADLDNITVDESADEEIKANREQARQEAQNAPVWRYNTVIQQKPVYKPGKEPKPAPPVVDSKGRCGKWC